MARTRIGSLAGALLLVIALGACDGDTETATVADTGAADSGADDAAPDTAGVIDPMCTLEMEGQPCDDADPCTLDDACAGGRCVGGVTLACSDPDPCRTARCEAGVGCVYEALGDGASCTLACFTSSTCQAGTCTPAEGSAKTCPESSDPCIDRFSCDASTGACSVPIYAPAGTECDRDEDLCTVDACDGAGTCEDTLNVETCIAQSANNPCWTYSCVKATGCVRSAFVEGAACDDLNPCTGDDVCLVNSMGQQTCLGQPLNIDDANSCTSDTCVGGVISHTPIDGIVCTMPDDLCVGTGLCEAGQCKTQPAVDCDDDDPCTSDSCIPASGACAHVDAPDNTPCSDENACTSLDRCISGQCVGTPLANCCGNGACEAGEGCGCTDCEGTACSDGDDCTATDICVAGQCAGTPQAGCCGNGVCEAGEACACVADCDTLPCDDGNACTAVDVCQGDQCVGSSPVAGCCGNGWCELGEGCECSDCDGELCDDNNACTSGETCTSGQCQGGGLLANCCGNGVCEPSEGCECGDCDGALCDDDNACTSGETCTSGQCQGGGLLANCCGNGVCEPSESCECGDCDGELCDDSDACTTGEVCGGGQCQGGDVVLDCCGNGLCEAGEDCTCADCEGEVCADEDVCTINTHCVGGQCVGDQLAECCGGELCDAGDVCFNDSCCTPRTCAQLGATCGSWDDTCGGVTASCGSCGDGYVCGASKLCELDQLTCGGVVCPSWSGYDSSCNAADYCEYASIGTSSWRQYDVWIWQPPGSFPMGKPSAEGDQESSAPVHTVTFSSGFFIAKYELTVAAYEACEAAGVCSAPAITYGSTYGGINRSADGQADYPQNAITHSQARAACGWVVAGGRLPSESEWEYAATGSTHHRYPWGASPQATCDNDYAVIDYCDPPYSRPVGSKPSGMSATGALNMGGNVFEMAADCYHSSYNGAPSNGSAWTVNCTDILGPSGMARGGGFSVAYDSANYTANRNLFPLAWATATTGVRCARD